MKPRVYLLFLIVAVYPYIPSYPVIPCFILLSFPFSQLSGHLLCDLISSPCFPVLYLLFNSLCPPLSQSSTRHPYPYWISPFVLQSTRAKGALVSPSTLPLKYSCKTDFYIFGQGKIGIVFPIGMARVSCPIVSSGSLWGFFTPCLSLFNTTAIACGFTISLPLLVPVSLQPLLGGFICLRGDLRHVPLPSSSRKL